jgi:hypothetical protein
MKHAGDFMVRAGQAFAHFIANDEQFLLKMGQSRRLTDERVRFLQERDDADSHGEELLTCKDFAQ